MKTFRTIILTAAFGLVLALLGATLGYGIAQEKPTASFNAPIKVKGETQAEADAKLDKVIEDYCRAMRQDIFLAENSSEVDPAKLRPAFRKAVRQHVLETIRAYRRETRARKAAEQQEQDDRDVLEP
ncbi:MAG TPA: hypothetical protein VD948_12980 [Rhodothermales bacterium]|nr:hypothetical protein [Rhodothermales bacterium]